MCELGLPGFLARLLARNVPRLERWAGPMNGGSAAQKADAWRPILAGGLICGALDINGAFLTAWVNAGMTPPRVLQAVASGLLGPGAFDGGAAVEAGGLLLHFAVAFTWTVVFYLLSRRLGFLRDQAVVSGLLYGAFVYLAMNLAVLPLAAQFRSLYIPGTKPFVPRLAWGQFGVHLTCVGLAISLAVRRWAPTKRGRLSA
jgi:hypothetical protein